MDETSSRLFDNKPDEIELLDRFKSVSALSLVLSVLMAVPSNISWNFSLDSPQVAGASPRSTSSGISLARKHHRVHLLDWADNSTIGDNAEEPDDPPIPLAIIPRAFGLPDLVPVSIQGGVPRRSRFSVIGLLNPPLRC